MTAANWLVAVLPSAAMAGSQSRNFVARSRWRSGNPLSAPERRGGRLLFGDGPHRCPGAGLTRVIAHALLTTCPGRMTPARRIRTEPAGHGHGRLPAAAGHPRRARLRRLLQDLGATRVRIASKSRRGRYVLLSHRTEPVRGRLAEQPAQELKASAMAQIRQALPPGADPGRQARKAGSHGP